MVGDCAKSHLGVVVFHGGVVVADRCVGGQEGRVVELDRDLVVRLLKGDGAAVYSRAAIAVAAEHLAGGEG